MLLGGGGAPEPLDVLGLVSSSLLATRIRPAGGLVVIVDPDGAARRDLVARAGG